mmetsp:Transcript_37307/g.84017  ORF Transcript_37307/g.84017 Transcript_37307/m.84017 type:complete len:220 (+) Transcript_37307:2107-2766(+)
MLQTNSQMDRPPGEHMLSKFRVHWDREVEQQAVDLARCWSVLGRGNAKESFASLLKQMIHHPRDPVEDGTMAVCLDLLAGHLTWGVCLDLLTDRSMLGGHSTWGVCLDSKVDRQMMGGSSNWGVCLDSSAGHSKVVGHLTKGGRWMNGVSTHALTGACSRQVTMISLAMKDGEARPLVLFSPVFYYSTGLFFDHHVFGPGSKNSSLNGAAHLLPAAAIG